MQYLAHPPGPTHHDQLDDGYLSTESTLAGGSFLKDNFKKKICRHAADEQRQQATMMHTTTTSIRELPPVCFFNIHLFFFYY